jgi:hypothetical protein
MVRWVMGMTVGIACVTVAGCAAEDGSSNDDVLREQLFAVDYDLVDAVADVDGLVTDDDVISAEAVPGVDDVEYEIVTVDGEDVVTRVIDARTRRIVDETRERADRTRRDDADRLRLHRERLADRLRHARDERPEHRAARARLAGDDLESDWIDHRGRRELLRERLGR